jgi:hypothetical protein
MPLVKLHPTALFPGVPWPYVEGLSIQEAWNDMAFMAVGMYNSTLPAQNGAPIRMIVSIYLHRKPFPESVHKYPNNGCSFLVTWMCILEKSMYMS